MRYLSRNSRETAKLAKILAGEILKTKPSHKSALILALKGELGSGKTTFTQTLLKDLGVKNKILSPTFVIMKSFNSSKLKSGRIWHIDSYRIGPKDILSLGFKKLLSEPNIVIVEWADRIKEALPSKTIWIGFSHGQKPNERHLTFNRR